MRISKAVAATLLCCCCLVLSSCGSMTPQVKEYISQLPTTEERAPKADFYARKDTLKINGNLIIGNWLPNGSTAACTSQNNSALLLSKIDHFDDLGPCPNGSSLVRAVLK